MFDVQSAMASVQANPALVVGPFVAIVSAVAFLYIIKTFVLPVVKSLLIVGILVGCYMIYSDGLDVTVAKVSPYVNYLTTTVKSDINKNVQ